MCENCRKEFEAGRVPFYYEYDAHELCFHEYFKSKESFNDFQRQRRANNLKDVIEEMSDQAIRDIKSYNEERIIKACEESWEKNR